MRISSVLLSNNTILAWYHNMVWNIPTHLLGPCLASLAKFSGFCLLGAYPVWTVFSSASVLSHQQAIVGDSTVWWWLWEWGRLVHARPDRREWLIHLLLLVLLVIWYPLLHHNQILGATISCVMSKGMTLCAHGPSRWVWFLVSHGGCDGRCWCLWHLSLDLNHVFGNGHEIIWNDTKAIAEGIQEWGEGGCDPWYYYFKHEWRVLLEGWTCPQPWFDIFPVSTSEHSRHTGVQGGYQFVLRIWMSVLMIMLGQMLLKWANRQPRVKPGELDQTDGVFSTIVHQLNTQCTSGYIMLIHDIIATSLYHIGWS